VPFGDIFVNCEACAGVVQTWVSAWTAEKHSKRGRIDIHRIQYPEIVHAFMLAQIRKHADFSRQPAWTLARFCSKMRPLGYEAG